MNARQEDHQDPEADTASGGAPDKPDTSEPGNVDPDTVEQDGTPKENPSG